MKGLQGLCTYFSLRTDHKASERGVASSRFSLAPTASCKDWKGDRESNALVEDFVSPGSTPSCSWQLAWSKQQYFASPSQLLKALLHNAQGDGL